MGLSFVAEEGGGVAQEYDVLRTAARGGGELPIDPDVLSGRGVWIRMVQAAARCGPL